MQTPSTKVCCISYDDKPWLCGTITQMPCCPQPIPHLKQLLQLRSLGVQAGQLLPQLLPRGQELVQLCLVLVLVTSQILVINTRRKSVLCLKIMISQSMCIMCQSLRADNMSQQTVKALRACQRASQLVNRHQWATLGIGLQMHAAHTSM